LVLLSAFTGAALAALGVTVTASPARTLMGGGLQDLPVSNVNTPAGSLTALRSGVTYQASHFPLGLRVTPPDGTWSGAQWRTTTRGKPAYGWAQLGQGPTTAPPRGILQLETAYGPTPSVAATIARLQRGGSHLPASNVGGTTFQAAAPVKLAGYSGRQFDGNVWGIYGHTFVPFSATTGGASPADSYHLDKGESFRLVALNVNGKTVVLLYDNIALPAQQFPAFIASANRLLRSLTFHA
jgi:hypothetical protein